VEPGRLAVFGDSDFASNLYLKLLGNKDLFLSSVGLLAEEPELVAVRSKGQPRGTLSPIALTATQGARSSGQRSWHSGDFRPGGIVVVFVRRRRREVDEMSWRVTFALAVALIATALYAWFDLQHGGFHPQCILQEKPAATPFGTKAKPLAEFALQDVEAIRLQRGALRLQVGARTGFGRCSAAGRRQRLPLQLARNERDHGGRGFSERPRRTMASMLAADSIELCSGGRTNQLFVGSSNPTRNRRLSENWPRWRAWLLAGALLRWEVDKLTRALTEPASGNTTPSPES